MNDIELGRRFRTLRHRLGWPQRSVGEAAGLSQDTVSRIERGMLEAVALPTLRAVARGLGAELA